MEHEGLESPTPEPRSVGADLQAAREAAGLSLAEIAARTKIAERHLAAIEQGRFSDLASRTYAVGFSRSYARALGMDETEVAERVRRQIDAEGYVAPVLQPTFEPGDPARVPPLKVVGWAVLGIAVVIGLVFAASSSFFSPEGALPSLLPKDEPSKAASNAAPAVVPTPVAQGPVTLTALADGVWFRVKDGAGKTLVERTLAKGESWTVPPGVTGANLRTGRPDALQISMGGKALPLLSDSPKVVSGVSLDPAALLGQPASAQASAPAPTPAATAAIAPPRAPVPAPTVTPRPIAASATPSASASATPRPAASAVRTPTVLPSPTPSRTLAPPATQATRKPAPEASAVPTTSASAVPASASPAPVSTTSD